MALPGACRGVLSNRSFRFFDWSDNAPEEGNTQEIGKVK
jgi:hypothetical protein